LINYAISMSITIATSNTLITASNLLLTLPTQFSKFNFSEYI